MYSKTVIITIGKEKYEVEVFCTPNTPTLQVYEMAHKKVIAELKQKQDEKLNRALNRIKNMYSY